MVPMMELEIIGFAEVPGTEADVDANEEPDVDAEEIVVFTLMEAILLAEEILETLLISTMEL